MNITVKIDDRILHTLPDGDARLGVVCRVNTDPNGTTTVAYISPGLKGHDLYSYRSNMPGHHLELA